MRKKSFLCILTIFFLFSSLVLPSSFASAQEISNPDSITIEEDFEPVIDVLSSIEDIPDDVISQGPEATVNWLSEKTGYRVYIDDNETIQFAEDLSDNVISQVPGGDWLPGKPRYRVGDLPFEEMEIQPYFNTWGCIGAVGIAIVSNGIPFSKILKVKKALNALGGTAKTVGKIKKYYDEYRWNGFSRSKSLQKAVDKASDTLGKDLKDALLDFFNISNVIANCT